MSTPNGPVCDYCGTPVTVTFCGFFSPELRACSLECLNAMEEARRYDALSKQFQLLRGWTDCSGKCRTWKVTDGNGLHIAEVTRKRDGVTLLSLLSGNGRANHA